MLARLVLYIAILIIFMIALVIINNALVMATLERVREIGTLRAIGAQRRFILAMLVIESLVVGLISSAARRGPRRAGRVPRGARSVSRRRRQSGSSSFSGPRLHPFIGTTNVIAAFIIVMLVSAFSSFYPAWLAMRVHRGQAMQETNSHVEAVGRSVRLRSGVWCSTGGARRSWAPRSPPSRRCWCC
jgi:hypothetical protein